MARRWLCLAAAVLMGWGLAVPARAAQRGTLRVTVDYGQNAARAAVALHFVAEETQGGYRLTESFGGGFLRGEDVHSPELAGWLGDMAGEGMARILDADGTAEFTDLGPGLYLLTQTEAPEGWMPADPVLIPIPLAGQWQVQAYPKTAQLLTPSPRTGQRAWPMAGAMGLVLSGTGLYFCLEKLRKK